jgi:hypothetical protein
VWFFHFKITTSVSFKILRLDQPLTITTQYLLGIATVLLATYLWTSDHGPRPLKIVVADYEKTTIGHQQPYSDSRDTLNTGRSSFKEALTTSRPSTPVNFERRGAGFKREE